MHLSGRHSTLGTMTPASESTPPDSSSTQPPSPSGRATLVAHTQQMAEVLAVEFSTSRGALNPDWDFEQPDGPDNRYYLTRTLAERVAGSPMLHFTDTDGHRSMRVPTFHELADTLVKGGAVVEVSTLTEEVMVENVLAAAFPSLHVQQRAAVRRDVRTILAALAHVMGEDKCHCGRVVAGASQESPAGGVLCAYCAEVRCDAFPGACTPPDALTS